MEAMTPFKCFLFFLLLGVKGEFRIGLNSEQNVPWIVWNQNKSVQIEGKVPGGIYTDLQSSGILDKNLFFRFNDIESRWVSKDSWTYQCVFNISKSFLNQTAINLVFHGIDSVGDIYLNGKFLKSVNNMFVRHVVPVKGIIQEKNNTLQVRLKSPVKEAKRLAEVQKKSYPVPPECTPPSYNGECHVNFLRKMQASFSWDWGPAFPSLGIWKSVEVEAFSLGVIRDLTVTPFKQDASWNMNITLHTEYADEFFQQPKVTATLHKSKNFSNIIPLTLNTEEMTTYKDDSGYVINLKAQVEENLIETWWPNGFGEQPLYDLIVSLSAPDKTEFSSKTVQVGYRSIELVQDEIRPGKEGLSFYFKVNGLPIFVKGSNWIPGHVLPELTYDKKMVRNALESAKEANMNMLRVWGGGVYESDFFYSVADELGLLIWQDMMFACSMYPTNREFLSSVALEVEQQVRRLQHHPSIALWAGNNENEAALVGSWYGTSKNYSLYKQDYIKLYVDTIRPVVLKNDKSRAYITSSPTNGKQSEKEGYVAKNPYSPLFGDVHYYNYIFDGWTAVYPDTRFASEYGFQSMPSFSSMSRITLPSDRNLESVFTQKRQHLPEGNLYLTGLIRQQLPLPKTNNSENFYKLYIYYTQVYQATSTKIETEKYRRDRSKLTEDNKGFTMGAMYWQLNDVWQAPTWSSIEFGGKWKMLHYFAKKFFSPVLVSSELKRDSFSVYLVSDLLEDVPNVRLNISLYSWNSLVPKKVISSNVLLTKASSKNHGTYELSKLLSQNGCTKTTCFVYLSVEGEQIFSDNFMFPEKLHSVTNMVTPKLSVKVKQSSEPKEAEVEVATDNVAPFVWLETEEEGEFSDNGFLLLKPQIKLKFKNRQSKPINMTNFSSTLKARSLI